VESLKKSGEFSNWIDQGENNISSLFPTAESEFFSSAELQDKLFSDDPGESDGL
jgi:hypothetical protein